MPPEIFPHPTVKEVFFEIKFPHLFSIENKIGEFQERIMNDFPESKQAFQRRLMFADTGPEGKFVNLPENFEPNTVQKLWIFKSLQDHEVKIQTNSLVISSRHHKTYNNATVEKKFRDVISFVVSNFLDIIRLPIIKRIGLRYVDECPLPIKNNATVLRLYNLSSPLEKFPMEDVDRVYFNVTTKRGTHNLTYQEGLVKKDNQYKLMFDFDGFATNIASANFLAITDKLHEIIETEYFSIIKEPIKAFMRTGHLE